MSINKSQAKGVKPCTYKDDPRHPMFRCDLRILDALDPCTTTAQPRSSALLYLDPTNLSQ